jgi:hypothetical protein
LAQHHVQVADLGRQQKDPAGHRGHCRHDQRQQRRELACFLHLARQQRGAPGQRRSENHGEYAGHEGEDDGRAHGVADARQFAHAGEGRAALGECAPLQLDDGPQHAKADDEDDDHPADLRRDFPAQDSAASPPGLALRGTYRCAHVCTQACHSSLSNFKKGMTFIPI